MIALDRILIGDASQQLRRLPAGSVDCVLTSPPYFRLRNYSHPGQLGLETHVDDWVQGLRAVMAELARVLVPTGTVWLNLGDSYSTGREGAPVKSLLLGPERLALALIKDGWIVRSKIVWAKRNPVPNPARDRLSCTWEVVYLLVRQRDYFFDLDAIRVPHTSSPPDNKARSRRWSVPPSWRVSSSSNSGLEALGAAGRVGHPLGKNPGDVWQLATSAYRGAHHAVFPIALADKPILAGCPERRCRHCHKPWQRDTARTVGRLALQRVLQATCACGGGWAPGVVLDPFVGSGTTAITAERHGRNWLGIELNPAFARLADTRISAARTQAASKSGADAGRRAA